MTHNLTNQAPVSSSAKGTRETAYRTLLAQIESLVDGETDLIANMANTAAAIHDTFGFWWVGFYRVVEDDCGADATRQLLLGPFQGPIACTRIPFGRGVCGTCWQREEAVIVPDVHQFAGHIACSSLSNSEIVVPVRRDGRIIAVLDIDSTDYDAFDTTDRHYLELICECLAR